MRIFLAGATGAIGRLLVPLLLADGHEVTALTRRASVELRGVTTVVGDVYDGLGLRQVVAAARPDVVMHQLTDLASRDFAANSRIRQVGTRNLVDAALTTGARRVISQSISWAYEGGDDPAVESTPLDLASPAWDLAAPGSNVAAPESDLAAPALGLATPGSDLAASNLAASNVAASDLTASDLTASDRARRGMVEAVAELENITAEAPEWVVLRYGMLYGPGTWYTKGGLMAGAALPTGPDITSFLHVEDAAIAAVQALNWPTGAVNIVDDEPAPASAWSPVFAKSVGAALPPPTYSRSSGPAGSPESARPAWARGASNAHARTHLAWTPTHPTWRTGFFDEHTEPPTLQGIPRPPT